MGATIRILLQEAAEALPGESARLDAEVLLAHCLSVPRSHLFAWPERNVSPAAHRLFEEKISRRSRGEPLAYLVGEREFWSLGFFVSPDTLIPRPETELLVAEALARCPPSGRVLELGTGSGAIAVALGHERPDLCIVATEVSDEARAMAERNARRHNVNNIRFVSNARRAGWFGAVAGQRFDLILANPPYVEDDDPGFEHGEIRFEPRIALAAGADGLDDLAKVIADAPAHLNEAGWLLLEHGCEQAAAVSRMILDAGLAQVETLPDLAGLPRVTVGRNDPD